MNDLELYKFELREFDSRDEVGSGSNMDKDFLLTLSSIRKELNRPMIVNSGYRTKAHNKRVGGRPDSAHTKGLAVDIRVLDNAFRYNLIRIAMKHGINRIGVYRTFIHLDMDSSKPSNVIWYG